MKKLLLSLGTVAAVVAPVASVVACGSSKTKAKTTDMAERSSVLDKIKAASGYDTMTDAQKKEFNDKHPDNESLADLNAELKKLTPEVKDGDANKDGDTNTDGETKVTTPTKATIVEQAKKVFLGDKKHAAGKVELTNAEKVLIKYTGKSLESKVAAAAAAKAAAAKAFAGFTSGNAEAITKGQALLGAKNANLDQALAALGLDVATFEAVTKDLNLLPSIIQPNGLYTVINEVGADTIDSALKTKLTGNAEFDKTHPQTHIVQTAEVTDALAKQFIKNLKDVLGTIAYVGGKTETDLKNALMATHLSDLGSFKVSPFISLSDDDKTKLQAAIDAL